MTEAAKQPAALRLRVAIPLIVFAALAGLFWYALHTGDPSLLPSAMIGKPVPKFTLPPLDGLKKDGGADVPGLSSADLTSGKPTIINVFASWCVPCLEEHPMLLELAKEPGVRLFAINYKDDPASARRFLGLHGDPYARVGADHTGRVAINFGVYGVPETYVISSDGKIAYRHVGPLTEETIKKKLLPLVQQPKSTAAGS
jgi:cytochrome c biogenesis protein CcmG/thiol:disulfide interchange protein DsbE